MPESEVGAPCSSKGVGGDRTKVSTAPMATNPLDVESTKSESVVRPAGTGLLAGTARFVKRAVGNSSDRYKQFVDADSDDFDKDVLTGGGGLSDSAMEADCSSDGTDTATEGRAATTAAQQVKNDFEYKELDDKYGSKKSLKPPTPQEPQPILGTPSLAGEGNGTRWDDPFGGGMSAASWSARQFQAEQHQPDRIVGHEHGERSLIDYDELSESDAVDRSQNNPFVGRYRPQLHPTTVKFPRESSRPPCATAMTSAAVSPPFQVQQNVINYDVFGSAPFRKKSIPPQRKNQSDQPAVIISPSMPKATDVFANVPFKQLSSKDNRPLLPTERKKVLEAEIGPISFQPSASQNSCGMAMSNVVHPAVCDDVTSRPTFVPVFASNNIAVTNATPVFAAPAVVAAPPRAQFRPLRAGQSDTPVSHPQNPKPSLYDIFPSDLQKKERFHMKKAAPPPPHSDAASATWVPPHPDMEYEKSDIRLLSDDNDDNTLFGKGKEKNAGRRSGRLDVSSPGGIVSVASSKPVESSKAVTSTHHWMEGRGETKHSPKIGRQRLHDELDVDVEVLSGDSDDAYGNSVRPASHKRKIGSASKPSSEFANLAFTDDPDALAGGVGGTCEVIRSELHACVMRATDDQQTASSPCSDSAPQNIAEGSHTLPRAGSKKHRVLPATPDVEPFMMKKKPVIFL